MTVLTGAASSIEVEFDVGTDISDAYNECARVLQSISDTVLDGCIQLRFSFNGVRCVVDGESVYQNFMQQYCAALSSVVDGHSNR